MHFREFVKEEIFPSLMLFCIIVGRLIDCFAVDSAVTSLSMSPTEDFLATCHVGDLGVYLWANRTLYSFVSLQPLPDDFEPRTLHMPATAERPAGGCSSGMSATDALPYCLREYSLLHLPHRDLSGQVV